MNAWGALLIGGAVVGGAILLTRRRGAGGDDCAELSKLDARAGAACRLWGGPVGEFIRDGAAGIPAAFDHGVDFVGDIITGDWSGHGNSLCMFFGQNCGNKGRST
jgi:hypothetical protein